MSDRVVLWTLFVTLALLGLSQCLGACLHVLDLLQWFGVLP